MSEIRFGGVACSVTRATCELYHLYFHEPDWTLDAETDGVFPRLLISGRVAAPALPGPSELSLSYIDDPRVVVLDGRRGSLDATEARSRLRLVELGGGRVRIEGTVQLVWRSFAADATQAYSIEVALEAALVT